MKRLMLAAATGTLTALTALAADAPAPDPVLAAMRDEIARASKLTVSNLDAPYFIQYVVDEGDLFSVSASLGGLLSRRRDHIRQPEITVRVGDYKFDNTNFAGRVGGTRYDLGRWPLDDSYPVLRRYFWLATDSAYKSAVETISRKRAALRNLTESNRADDFSHAQRIEYVHELGRLAIDENDWAVRVRALSAIFAEYPGVLDSRVELEAEAGGYYVVNSEGTVVRAAENAGSLRARAVAQAPDGMMLHDAVTLLALDPAHLPGDATLNSTLREMAQNLEALAKAPKGEDYSGPVLFEGAAGPQIFAELLGRNLALARKPEGGRGGFNSSELEGRLGARVLPESFDVVDDPTQREWRGQALFGAYDVDREGVRAQPLTLVEKGVLKGFLLTRQPVRGFSASNGHARLPGSYGAATAGIGNLFIGSSETMPAGDLKKKLIELVQARGLAYGVMVRKMDYPSTASLDELRRMFATADSAVHPVSSPVLVYKVYPDGREELVRGLRFRGLNVRSLKDILVAGDDDTVFDYLDNGAPLALVGAGSYTTESCVVAPSIIVDDLELHPVEEELPKLPVAPPPEVAR
ncbi:MAG: metallopeptidase TldD-related protein [Bryobacteraceae bacterium]